MIPTNRFALLLAVGGLLIGFSSRATDLLPAGLALISLSVVLALADWLAVSRVRIELERICDDKLSLGTPNPVHLVVRNASQVHARGMLRDEYPEGMQSSDNIVHFQLPLRSEQTFVYHVIPPQRGDFEFRDTYIRLCGPFGIMLKQTKYSTARGVKVYPNMLEIRRYEMTLRRQREAQLGQRQARLRGRGTDFESLRDYSPDDEFRAIDWKATARRGKLITRQYQLERSQNILILLDCGRTMGPVIDNLSRLDHSINSAMLLAYVAAVRGDRVGLLAFADNVITFLAPKAGRSQLLRLLGLTYNLQIAESDSDYSRAFSYLASRWTRRSLVVLFTDLIDPESSRPLLAQVANLARKHLSVCVTTADPEISRIAYEPAQDIEAAYASVVARQSIQARKLAAAQLRAAGAMIIDVEPCKFAPAVVDAYLNIKAAGRL